MAASCKQLRDAETMIAETVGLITNGRMAGQTAKVQLWEGHHRRRYVVIRWADGSKYCKRFSGGRYELADGFYRQNAEALTSDAGPSLALMSR